MSDRYRHMQEAWGIEANPFPAEAIDSDSEPYNPDVFSEELEQFRSRLIYGSAMDRRGFGFLWSKGRNGEDTGFGKTKMLRHVAREVNGDFGETVLRDAGMKVDLIKKHEALAAYASLNTTTAGGVYPILFGAVEYLADPKFGVGGISILSRLRARIREINNLDEDDSDGLIKAILDTRRKLGPTLPPLNDGCLKAFRSTDDGHFAAFLSTVTSASRIRNGLGYFDFAFAVAATAGLRHIFVFVDQLEDLATVQTITKAKRSREIGRLRDIIAETDPFSGRVHFVFTFHIRAANALDEMWRLNRLPSWDPEDPANEGSVVVLRGIQNHDQVRDILITYLDSRRIEGETHELMPFDESTLPVLLNSCGGRVGILLAHAQKLFDRAADLGSPSIDGSFAADMLGASGAARLAGQRRGTPGEPRDARAIDSLLN
jgi:hypothetical protein